MYTVVPSTKFVGFQLRFVVLLQLSHKPVCSCPQHGISKLAVVYGVFLLKQSCVRIPQIFSCVTQPVGFLGVPKKKPEFFCVFGFFQVLKNKRKTYYPLPLPTRAAKSTYFPKGFGMPCFYLLWLCDPAGAGVSTCLCHVSWIHMWCHIPASSVPHQHSSLQGAVSSSSLCL